MSEVAVERAVVVIFPEELAEVAHVVSELLWPD
jgi:hypothetical protein